MNTVGITFLEPELEREIAGVVVRTTWLVRDDADKDDVRRVFARLARLKSRRNPIDIYRNEYRINLGVFL